RVHWSSGVSSPDRGRERAGRGATKELRRERKPVRRRAPRAARRGDGADLAGEVPETRRMEPDSKQELNLRVAVPAEVDDGSLRGEQIKRAFQPTGGGAGVHNQIIAAGGLTRERE